TAVPQQDARAAVAGDIGIGPAVAVEVRRHRSQSVALAYRTHSGVLTYVFEAAVSPIVIESQPPIGQTARSAKHRNSAPDARRQRSGRRRLRGVELLISRHEQVQSAVAVIIEKRAARRPLAAGSAHTGTPSYSLEASIASVAIQLVAA